MLNSSQPPAPPRPCLIGAAPAPTVEPVVHLFVDLSNVYLGAQASAVDFEEYGPAVRLSAENLHRVMAAGRPVASATLVANALVPEAALRHFRPWFRIVRAETGRQTGTEVAADQILQNALLLELVRPQEPGVIVLATGDGAGVARRPGVRPDPPRGPSARLRRCGRIFRGEPQRHPARSRRGDRDARRAR